MTYFHLGKGKRGAGYPIAPGDERGVCGEGVERGEPDSGEDKGLSTGDAVLVDVLCILETGPKTLGEG